VWRKGKRRFERRGEREENEMTRGGRDLEGVIKKGGAFRLFCFRAKKRVPSAFVERDVDAAGVR